MNVLYEATSKINKVNLQVLSILASLHLAPTLSSVIEVDRHKLGTVEVLLSLGSRRRVFIMSSSQILQMEEKLLLFILKKEYCELFRECLE